MSRSVRRFPVITARASVLLLGLPAALVLATFMDAGIYWDEPTWGAYGSAITGFFTTLGKDDSALRYSNWYLYGGLYDGFLDVIRRLSPLSEVDTRHLVNGMVGVAGMGATMMLARSLAGGAAGILAGVLLAIHPAWWGQMFTNPKDIPFAVAHALALVILLAIIRSPKEPTRGMTVLAGLGAGLAMAVRTGGVILLVYLALALLARKWINPGGRGSGRKLLSSFALALAVAWVVMIACWPYALLHPFTGPVKSFLAFNRFELGLNILFDGTLVPVNALPRSYLSTYLLRSSPEPWLVLALAGVLISLASLARAKSRKEREFSAGAMLLVLAGLFPVAYIALTRAPVYTGMRHILFVLPVLSALGGVALWRVWEAMPGRKMRLGLAVALGGWSVFHLGQLAVLHPYEYLYFNPVSGGLKGAEGKFELDDSSHTLREAADRLVGIVKLRDGASFGKKVHTVFVCPSPFSAAPEFPPSWRLTGKPAEADFALYTAHSLCSFMKDWKVIDRVERMGVPLAYVVDLRARRFPANPRRRAQ